MLTFQPLQIQDGRPGPEGALQDQSRQSRRGPPRADRTRMGRPPGLVPTVPTAPTRTRTRPTTRTEPTRTMSRQRADREPTEGWMSGWSGWLSVRDDQPIDRFHSACESHQLIQAVYRTKLSSFLDVSCFVCNAGRGCFMQLSFHDSRRSVVCRVSGSTC